MATGPTAPGDNLPIHIQGFVETWKDTLSSDDILGVRPQSYMEFMKQNTTIHPKVLSELDVVCGVDTLNCPEEPKDKELLLLYDMKRSDIDLCAVKYQCSELEKRVSVKYRRKVQSHSKYRDRLTPWKHKELTEESQGVVLSDPQALITIEIYRPFPRGRKPLLEQEIQFLGTHYLSDLRDKIFCVSDHMVPGDCSAEPNVQPDIYTKDVYKSNFLFIEGTFYNDFRDVHNLDNSQVICDWALKENQTVYEKKKMDEVCFWDLSVKLGYPYVYQHQGNCEHLVVFSDIRLLHKEDCCDSSKYPLITLQRSPKRVMCRVCQMYFAKWVTRNNAKCPEDPCFFCNTCYQAFHYNVYGKKIYEFEALRYPEKFAP